MFGFCKNIKKGIAILLSVSMLAGVFPTPIFAESDNSVEEQTEAISEREVEYSDQTEYSDSQNYETEFSTAVEEPCTEKYTEGYSENIQESSDIEVVEAPAETNFSYQETEKATEASSIATTTEANFQNANADPVQAAANEETEPALIPVDEDLEIGKEVEYVFDENIDTYTLRLFIDIKEKILFTSEGNVDVTIYDEQKEDVIFFSEADDDAEEETEKETESEDNRKDAFYVEQVLELDKGSYFILIEAHEPIDKDEEVPFRILADKYEEPDEPESAETEEIAADNEIESYDQIEKPEEKNELQFLEYEFPFDTVALSDILNAVGIVLADHKYHVYTDDNIVEVSRHEIHTNKDDLSSITLTAQEPFDLVTLYIISKNGNDNHAVMLSYREAEDPEPVFVEYTFEDEGDYVMLLDLLSGYGIDAATIDEIVITDGDETDLAIQEAEEDYIVIPTAYFDAVTLSIRLLTGELIELTLHYPHPQDVPIEVVERGDDNPLKAGENLYITGNLPAEAIAETIPVDIETGRGYEVATYDISIYANEAYKEKGESWQPEEPVNVRLFDERFQNTALDVYHIPDGGDPEYVTTVTPENGWVEFQADGFSIYAFTTLEKTIVATDGNTYKISVTYNSETGLPENADLDVVEVVGSEYEEYVGRTSVFMETAGFGFARVFDISIIDENGNELQPATPVDVSIELLNAESEEESYSIVHFGEITESINSQTTGNTVSFKTDSFSAYVIVNGPAAMDAGWERITDMSQFMEHIQTGIYIGHVDGYYIKNGVTTIKAGRTGLTKTKPPQAAPPVEAIKFFFEPVEGGENQFKIYCVDDTGKKYVGQYNSTAPANNSLNYVTEDKATVFTVEPFDAVPNTFRIKGENGFYWNMQGGASGASFAAYNSASDVNAKLCFWNYKTNTNDPFDLDGKTYGLMNWTGGVTGRAMMATSSNEGTLDAVPLTVLSHNANNSEKMFTPKDSEISMWTFHYSGEDDLYYITTETDDGTRYLKITSTGIVLAEEQTDSCKIKVVPGAGQHANELLLSESNGSAVLNYSGNINTGFGVNGGTVGGEWLHFLEQSELTSDYFITYSASKVSVSDPSITNGSRVIVYTRSWNDTTKKYEYYAVDHDGSLVRCYENGDHIQWVGSQLNTLLWNFTEYLDETTQAPNYYYELYNQYSQEYIAPQLTGDQILQNSTIGINMNGRRDGNYQSPIFAWDEAAYSYAGLKVDRATGKLVSCPVDEALDFYFATIVDIPIDDTVSTVKTLDNNEHGIIIKMKDFATRKEMSDFIGSDAGGLNVPPNQGLLSTDLDENGYPKTKATGKSFAELYSGSEEVNHLFIESTYLATGYYEFNSTQNFAQLNTETGDFTLYNEIGSYDANGTRPTLQHGQFFPYNTLKPGVFASANGKNLTASTGDTLPESDPRKYEQLYLVQPRPGEKTVDYYFGMEIEASFTQTSNGLDAWGHDIIYEFTGDDDFWLYVDGELIIDLGGIHSALAGNVNYSTGEVMVNGQKKTLYSIFYNNYKGRGHTDAEAQTYVDNLFVLNEDGNYIFKDYSVHTMRIFYMERGAGASNLAIRFNLASVKPGTVDLSKRIEGIDHTESVMAEFPYQICYMKEDDPTEYYLTPDDENGITVTYKDTVDPVPYKETFTIPGTGITYDDVFILKHGETAVIQFPDDAISYRIKECGVNTEVYKKVIANDDEITGSDITVAGNVIENRQDFATDYDTVKNRTRVQYANVVNPDAIRTLKITKKLYREDGVTEISHLSDDTLFNFRLYLGNEFDETLDAANMYTYHVIDPSGNYCRWNPGSQSFEAIDGATDYELLTTEQKRSATFYTSIFGAISKIPSNFTVEVPGILAGTSFKVQERPYEIPDGYSFKNYIYNGTGYTGNLTDAMTGVTDTAVTSEDPHVYVCNIRGYGFRMNKIWTDENFMAEREGAYFAIYADDGSGNPILVNNSVRYLPFGSKSIYWYYLMLPISGTRLDDYVIKEVSLTGEGISVDQNNMVTGYDTITPIPENGEVGFIGRQAGDPVSAMYTYNVEYEKGETEAGSNVRTDTITNSREGLIIKKAAWDGTPLSGATFTLTDTLDNNLGNYTSDASGNVVNIFLRDNEVYSLDEVKSPRGYEGLQSSFTICKTSEGFSVNGIDPDYYTLTQNPGESAVLTIKNRPYEFIAIKKDAQSMNPIQGVVFALHKQRTVDGVTAIDINPMAGFENLTTGSDGIVPGIDSTLTPGVYELREKSAPGSYHLLTSHTRFTVCENGTIVLGSHPDEVSLTSDTDIVTGMVSNTLTILNDGEIKLTIHKTVTGNAGDRTRQFLYTLVSVADEAEGTVYNWVKTGLNGQVTTGVISTAEGNNTFTLAHDEKIEIIVPSGKELVFTEENDDYHTTWSMEGTETTEGAQRSVSITKDSLLEVVNNRELYTPTGVHNSTIPFITIFLAGFSLVAGAMLLPVVIGRKRNKKQKENQNSEEARKD